MAIYTQYGRYIKAKLFKEMLEKSGDTYMALGFGNPRWDEQNSNKQDMPIAPYDEDIKSLEYTETEDNPFKDPNSKQYFICEREHYSNENNSEELNKLIPKFPCLWNSSDNPVILVVDGTEIRQNDYYKYYVSNDALFDVTQEHIVEGIDITLPEDNVQKQYFSELYLRGKAIENNDYKHPVGLLGIVKCSIHFVKDIGTETDGKFTNNNNQFWYGDRYWEIVDPPNDISKYDEAIYPHHLYISAVINPFTLCDTRDIEVNLSPREIAIYTRHKDLVIKDGEATYEKTGKGSYKVGDYIYNFGQYTDAELKTIIETIEKYNILQMIPEYTDEEGNHYGGVIESEDGTKKSLHFDFVLHDYIKGVTKPDAHVTENIGYIIGF